MTRLLTALSTLFLLGTAAGCAVQPVEAGDSGGNTRYLCYTYVDSKHVLTLPVAPLQSEVGMVTVTFHGERLEATYIRNGLTQLWVFEDGLYVKVDPDLTAGYMDFRGAEEGETRKPESVFECRKKRRKKRR